LSSSSTPFEPTRTEDERGQMNPIPDALTDDIENGRVPLGRLFVESGLLNDAQVEDALFEGSQTGERLGEIVVRRGLISEEDLARTLAEQWSLSYVDRASIFFDPGALGSLSREDAQHLEAMPTRVQDGRIVVAVAEPTEQRLQALRDVIGEDTVMVVVPRAALDAALSSELLTSRTPASERKEAWPTTRSKPEADPKPVFEPLEALEVLDSPPPPAYREQPAAPAPPTPVPPLLANADLPAFLADPGGTPDPGSPAEIEELRLRVKQLEVELEQRNAVAFEVQRHLQAALRRLYS
jgi:hypothetical protein